MHTALVVRRGEPLQARDADVLRAFEIRALQSTRPSLSMSIRHLF